jgi:archaeal flagellar protein FlaJ
MEKEKRKKLKRKRIKKSITICAVLSIVIGGFAFLFSRSIIGSTITGIFALAFLITYIIVRTRLKNYKKIKKMEDIFPDFLQLMASNLRAGLTVDRALLASSRKEFAPLNIEINAVGKEILTGNDIQKSLKTMSERIKSDKISKTVNIINSGLASGGNLAVLLEETAFNMRERGFVEKKAASSVLMYVIFTLFAIGVGAPILFSLSSVMVEVLSRILSTLPELEETTRVPFTLTGINVSVNFIIYFSLAFMVATNILGSLVIGLVSKGQEKEGVKFMIPLILLSVAIFFILRLIVGNYISGTIG